MLRWYKRCFWILDTLFYTKDTPNKIPRRAAEIFYLGKKRMSLHCDIFFMKNKDVLVKNIFVYLTAVYKCDQDILATLNVVGVILKK